MPKRSWLDSDKVDRRHVTAHLRRLRNDGLTDVDIAARAGLPTSTIRRLRSATEPTQFVDRGTAQRVLAVAPPPRVTIPRAGWWDDAACKGDPGPWVLNIRSINRRLTDRVDRRKFRRQLAVCAACPVREDCLEDAIDFEVRRRRRLHHWQRDLSIRGGLLPDDIIRLVDTRMGVTV